MEPVRDSFFVPLPEIVLAKLGVKDGDTLYATETAPGILLTREDPDEERER